MTDEIEIRRRYQERFRAEMEDPKRRDNFEKLAARVPLLPKILEEAYIMGFQEGEQDRHRLN